MILKRMAGGNKGKSGGGSDDRSVQVHTRKDTDNKRSVINYSNNQWLRLKSSELGIIFLNRSHTL